MHDDAYVGLTGRLPVAADEEGTAVVMATSYQAFLLEPIAMEQQVRRLVCSEFGKVFRCCHEVSVDPGLGVP